MKGSPFKNALASFMRIIRESKAFFAGLLDRAEPFLPYAAAFIYAFSLSLGTVYCAVSSKQLPINHALTIIGCILFSAGAVLYFSKKLRLTVRLCFYGAVLLLILIFRRQIFSACHDGLIRLFYTYGHTSEIFITKEQYEALLSKGASVTLFALLLAAILSFLTAWTVVKRRPLWLVLSASSALVFYSCMFFDKPPKVFAVILCFFAMLMLVLTQRVRRMDTAAGARQSVCLFPAAAAFLLAAALIVNPGENSRPEFLKKATVATANFFRDIGYDMGIIDGGQTAASPIAILKDDTVDLSGLIPQYKMGMSVFSYYTTSESSVVYFRGISYGRYKNNQWLPLPDSENERVTELMHSPLTEPINAQSGFTAEIKTTYDCPVIYLPYFTADTPSGCVPVGDSYIENTAKLHQYSLTVGSAPNQSTFFSNTENDLYVPPLYRRFVFDNYLDIPDDTARVLRETALSEGLISLEEYSSGRVFDVSLTAENVCDFVRESADYSLNSEGSPRNTDFALWFLSDADSGYCVHFASTAAVMLRALGIPSRYVSGYAAYCRADEWNSVLSDNAHAWVEYYDEHRGWVAIDPTPVSFEESSQEPVSEGTTVPSASDSPLSSSTSVSGGTSASKPSASPSQHGTRPSFGGNINTENSKKCEGSPVLPLVISLILLVILCSMPMLRNIIIKKRSERIEVGTANSRALAMWDYILLLSKCGGTAPSERIENLALKARFSSHTLNEDELHEIKEFLDASLRSVTDSSGTLRGIINKYIFFYY